MNFLNATLYEHKVKYSKSSCFLISLLKMSIITELWMFLNTDQSTVCISPFSWEVGGWGVGVGRGGGEKEGLKVPQL